MGGSEGVKLTLLRGWMSWICGGNKTAPTAISTTFTSLVRRNQVSSVRTFLSEPRFIKQDQQTRGLSCTRLRVPPVALHVSR